MKDINHEFQEIDMNDPYTEIVCRNCGSKNWNITIGNDSNKIIKVLLSCSNCDKSNIIRDHDAIISSLFMSSAIEWIPKNDPEIEGEKDADSV